MEALLLVLLHPGEVRSISADRPIALSRIYTPPDRGIPNRRVGAGTR